MHHLRTLAIAFTVSASLALPLLAGPQRTFVSATGVDMNPCSRELPCRTFAAAMAQTAAGGEIVVLDSAGYGPVTIAQSVTIVAPQGVYAGITAFTGQTAVAIIAADIDVTLRNLSLNGQGGSTGVVIGAAAPHSLMIDHCSITGFNGTGVSISSGSVTPVTINDTLISRNGSNGVYSFGGELVMNRCVVSYNLSGVVLDRYNATIRDTVLVHNSSYGLFAMGSAGQVDAALENVLSTHNAYGISVDTATVTMHGGGVVHNTLGGVYVGKNWGTGPAKFAAQDAELSHNPYGISIASAAEATLTGCTLAANGSYGAVLNGTFPSLRITRNTFTESDYGIYCSNQQTVHSTADNAFHSNVVDKASCAMQPLAQY